MAFAGHRTHTVYRQVQKYHKPVTRKKILKPQLLTRNQDNFNSVLHCFPLSLLCSIRNCSFLFCILLKLHPHVTLSHVPKNKITFEPRAQFEMVLYPTLFYQNYIFSCNFWMSNKWNNFWTKRSILIFLPTFFIYLFLLISTLL